MLEIIVFFKTTISILTLVKHKVNRKMKCFSKMLISAKNQIKNVNYYINAIEETKKISKKKLATCYLRLHYFRR